MNAGGHDWNKILILLFPLLIFFSICKKPEPATISKQPAEPDSLRSNAAELMLNSESDFKESIDTLQKLIKEKEAELNIAQQKLKQREAQLAKIEIETKKLRSISYFTLAIGLISIMIGLFLVLSRRKSERNPVQMKKE